MRIIIEVEPGTSQAVIETEGTASASSLLQAVDGGPPAQDLLEALGEAAEDLSSLRGKEVARSVGNHPENAGAVPDWLVDSVESDQRKDPARADGG